MLPTGRQLGDEPMPLPRVAASTGDQGVGCQRSLLPALDSGHERATSAGERATITAPCIR
jgi:hypothetical protein